MGEALPKTASLSIGGNNPPINELLTEQYQELLLDFKSWIERAGRAPTTIEDDKILTGVGHVITELVRIRKIAETAHTLEKAPVLVQSRGIDTFFNANIIRVCEDTEKSLAKRQSFYLTAKADRERAEADAKAKAAQEEAEALQRAAQSAEDHGDIQTASEMLSEAAQAETVAVEAQARVEAPVAELVKTRGAQGNTVSAKAEWTFEIVDFDAIDLNSLRSTLSRTEIERAIKAQVKLGIRNLKGVKIFEDLKASNRR